MSVCWALGLFCRSRGLFVLLLVTNPQLLPVRPGSPQNPPVHTRTGSLLVLCRLNPISSCQNLVNYLSAFTICLIG